MALPPGATARDRWLELADAARANREEARAVRDHEIAGLWDEQERTLLDNAYGDVPFPDGAAPESGLDPKDGLPAADDASTLGQFLMAADDAASPGRQAGQAERPTPKVGDTLSGKASFYDLGGQPMSNGKLMDPNAMTAAVRPNAIPLGSTVDVSLASDPSRHITVTITDHGMIDTKRSEETGAWVEHPRTKGRIIDLTPAAFEALIGDTKKGLGDVTVKITKLPDKIQYFTPRRPQAKPSE